MPLLPKLPATLFIRSLWRIFRGRPRVPASLQHNPLLATILSRRSVRRFAPDPIPEDIFAAILEAGRLAPSTVNLQTWSFGIFTPESWLASFGRPIPMGAQRAVIILADTCRDKSVLDVFPASPLVEYTTAVMNASLAAMNMNIAAEALGVSSVMLSETGRAGFLDAAYLKEKLSLPGGVFPLMTIVFGFAAGPYPPMPPKLPLSEITFTSRYRTADPAVMQDWLAQMMTGYTASKLGASFEGQFRVYQNKIGQAEAALREMILGPQDGRDPLP